MVLHVVQISRDADLLRLSPDSEPCQRQVDYARELAIRAPGAFVTIIVLSPRRGNGWERGNLQVRSAAATHRGALDCVRMLHRLHRRAPISVITTQVPYDEAWLALALGRWHGIPVIGQVNSALFGESAIVSPSRRLTQRLRDWAIRRTLAWFDALRTVSSESRTSITRFTGGIPHATIPVPVPMVTAAAQSDGRRTGPPRVIFVGRLAPEKDLGTWLRVAAAVSDAHPDARFEIVGDGPDRAMLEDEARRLGLGQVLTFAGFVPYNRLQDIYARATVLLLTSRAEGSGRVLVEAASQGTPAVATLVAGPRDLVINGVTGVLHESGDVAGLARSVSRLIEQPSRAADMGSRARALVTVKFDPRRLRAAWIDLWISTAATSRHS